MKPLTNPISIRAICDKINEHFGDKPSYYQIRRMLRKDLAYSYKRGSSRLPKYKDSKLLKRKGEFWVELMKMMQKQLTIYNVVEWSFERSLKQTYSWLPRSKGGSIVNDLNIGKVTLILATGSDSTWFTLAKSKIVNSYTFWIFLILFDKILSPSQSEDQDSKIILLDNAKRITPN